MSDFTTNRLYAPRNPLAKYSLYESGGEPPLPAPRSIILDGVDESVQLFSDTVPADATTDKSFGWWMKIDTSTSRTLLSTDNISASPFIRCIVGTGGSLRLDVYDNSLWTSGGQYVTGSGVIPDEEWVLVGLSHEFGVGVQLYVNGSPVASTPSSRGMGTRYPWMGRTSSVYTALTFRGFFYTEGVLSSTDWTNIYNAKSSDSTVRDIIASVGANQRYIAVNAGDSTSSIDNLIAGGTDATPYNIESGDFSTDVPS